MIKFETLREVCQQIGERFAVEVSEPTMCRALKRLNLKRKKRVSLPVSVNRKE
ncbi:MAG TPA: hypothetical protein VNI60_00690 [Pyrinomonadaceae bacterium]|nr:hypothetical protein [Pyrinomonadaceae bacterium]